MTAPHRYPPQAPHPYGQVPYGQVAYGQAPYGQVPYGQVAYGEAPYAQVPYGQVPYGQRPPYQPAPWQQPQWAPTAPRPAIRRPWVIALIVLAAVTVLATLVLAAASGAPTTTAAPTRGAHCPGGSLEGCYTEDQMPAFLEQAVTFVQGFSDDRYQRMPRPAGYQLIPAGRTAQSPCGAFVGWAQEKGYLEDGDARDIAGLVRAIASSEDDPGRDHGTLAEREAALSTGIRDGLPGCSAFSPQTPVHEGS